MNTSRVLAVLLVIACSATAFSQLKSDQLRDEVAAYVPANASDLTVSKLGDAPSQSIIVAAWSTRSKPENEANTTVVVVNRIGQKSHLVKRFSIEYGYSPKVIVRPEFTFGKTPVALVQVQYGVAAAGIQVLGVNGGTVRILCSLDADDFEFVTLDNTPILLAHRDENLFDVPHLYRWTGSLFVDDSVNHRDFYRNLVATIRAKYDVSKFAPAVQKNFAQILSLSGDTQKTDK